MQAGERFKTGQFSERPEVAYLSGVAVQRLQAMQAGEQPEREPTR
jgi:hypothetical protein